MELNSYSPSAWSSAISRTMALMEGVVERSLDQEPIAAMESVLIVMVARCDFQTGNHMRIQINMARFSTMAWQEQFPITISNFAKTSGWMSWAKNRVGYPST